MPPSRYRYLITARSIDEHYHAITTNPATLNIYVLIMSNDVGIMAISNCGETFWSYHKFHELFLIIFFFILPVVIIANVMLRIYDYPDVVHLRTNVCTALSLPIIIYLSIIPDIHWKIWIENEQLHYRSRGSSMVSKNLNPINIQDIEDVKIQKEYIENIIKIRIDIHTKNESIEFTEDDFKGLAQSDIDRFLSWIDSSFSPQ